MCAVSCNGVMVAPQRPWRVGGAVTGAVGTGGVGAGTLGAVDDREGMLSIC